MKDNYKDIRGIEISIPLNDSKLAETLYKFKKGLLKLHINNCEIGMKSLEVIKSIFENNRDLYDFRLRQCKIQNKINESLSGLFTTFKESDPEVVVKRSSNIFDEEVHLDKIK